MRFSVILILLLVACAGCQTQPVAPTAAEWREKLRTVTLADGISQSEAQIIGECYFARHVGCGAFSGVHDGGDRWIVDGAVGYAAVPVQGFYIDKRSGKVVSPIGPSYDNPLDIFP
jgi:hypothetical protein